jgi:hypothetical protein
MMRVLSSDYHRRGAVLIVVLSALGLLTAITAIVLFTVLNRFRALHQTSVWQEALIASEAGIHQGMAQLEEALSHNGMLEGQQTFRLELSHAGETTNLVAAEYTVRRSDLERNGVERPFYSIVSTGTAQLGGGVFLNLDKADANLRKLRAGGRAARRSIEAWAAPRTSTDFALKVDKALVLNSHRVLIDSFDSRDPNRSLSGGQPPTVPGQFNVAPYNVMKANIGTNANLIDAGGASIYGDALTNGGKVQNAGGVHGTIDDDHFEALAPVYPPEWAVAATPGGLVGNLLSSVTSALTLRGGTRDQPARYVVENVLLAGINDIITFDFGKSSSGQPDPSKGYVEVYVRGNFESRGGPAGSLMIVDGVQVKVWFAGDLKLVGNSVSNGAGLASRLAFYGVNAPTPKPDQTVEIHGNAGFYGSVYAPSADLYLAGGGSKGTFVGSLVGKNAYLNGSAEIRYDEALGGMGIVTGFKLVSWFEDTKLAGSFDGKL